MPINDSSLLDGAHEDRPRAVRPPARTKDYPGTELLRTHRLILRELRFSDVGNLSNLHQEKKVREMLLEPVPVAFLEIAGLVILANRTYTEKPGCGIWLAEDHQGNFVGLFSLMPIADSDEVELGARLMPEMFGRLYSLEGARALRDYAFACMPISRLHGFCHPENHAVPAIFRRLGFSAAGEAEHFGNPALKFLLERSEILSGKRTVAKEQL